MWSSLHGHGAADILVGNRDFIARKSEVLQNGKVPVRKLRVGDLERFLAELLPEGPLVERKADLKGLRNRGVHFGQDFIGKALGAKRVRVDMRAAFERPGSLAVSDDIIDLERGVAQGFE